MIAFKMRYPPSVNTYWRNIKGRVLISAKGRAYRQSVKTDIGGLFAEPINGQVRVEINAYAPDNRRRDLDNILKATLDALTFCGAWLDDSQVSDLRVIRGEIVKPDGFLYIRINNFID